MLEIENKIMNIMEDIEYGFPDENGNNLIISNPKKYEQDFYKFYYLLTPTEFTRKKYGVCWDQVELEMNIYLKKIK